ncbi:sugar ABC transporter ATP-binding protein [Conexibacter sp. DBS9H8]|uniref:sugar ABC transporter ATP-binding protein n=1 Tax=Conexibacter sp. DBS9H8 TaxID=2937801 RepID=UPI00200BD944|nr:sugar ABC transporter ATP-binding protein [Conexibacter sp. DBS9H8]
MADPTATTTTSAATSAVDSGIIIDHVTMAFAGRNVLHDVSMTFPAATVTGLIGHNGSGKSTLVRIIAGYHKPVWGSAWLGGERVDSPVTAARLGLRFVHQDLGLIPEFTPVENFGIGGTYSQTRVGSVDWKEQRRRMEDVYDLLDCPVPPNKPISKLAAVERSLIAIARAVRARPGDASSEDAARFIVLDEPTTTLEAAEAEQLFRVVNTMVGAGIGALFISHHLKDVLNLCSGVHVLRDGYHIGTFDCQTATRSMLVEAMLGAETAAAERESAKVVERRHHSASAAPVVDVKNLTSISLHGVDLTLHKGECVAVVGLAGSGREEITYALAGAIPIGFDSMMVGGSPVSKISPKVARQHRVALAPGNRLPGTLINDFSLRENLTLVSLEELSGRGSFINKQRERAKAREWIRRFDIKPDDTDYGSRYLSGGNKQKLIIAKWLSIGPQAMLIDEPIAGVDVGAVAMLFDTLRTYVAEGGSLLFSTSELDDALALADRVIVLNEGRVIRELIRGTDEITETSLLLAMVEGSPATDSTVVPSSNTVTAG